MPNYIYLYPSHTIMKRSRSAITECNDNYNDNNTPIYHTDNSSAAQAYGNHTTFNHINRDQYIGGYGLINRSWLGYLTQPIDLSVRTNAHIDPLERQNAGGATSAGSHCSSNLA